MAAPRQLYQAISAFPGRRNVRSARWTGYGGGFRKQSGHAYAGGNGHAAAICSWVTRQSKASTSEWGINHDAARNHARVLDQLSETPGERIRQLAPSLPYPMWRRSTRVAMLSR